MDHEADDQERPERELAERERRADREALAEVVQPDSDRDERRERGEPVRRNVSVRYESAKPSSTTPAPPSAEGSPACSSSASESASTARNASSPAVIAMNAASHSGGRGAATAARAKRDGDDADEQADDAEAEDAFADGSGVSTAAAISSSGSRSSSSHRSRSAHPGPMRTGSRSSRSEGAERLVAVEVNGTIASSTITCAIVRSSCCGFVTRTRISPGLNSTRARRTRRRAAACAEQVEHGAAGRGEERDDADQQHERHECPQAPTRSGALGERRQSTTSKKPIHPSSANSDWCAWNMKCPVFAKSISRIPRSPCASDGVGVLDDLVATRVVVAEEVAVQVERVDQVELGEVREVDPNGL